MRKTFLILVLLILAGLVFFIADAGDKEFKDVRINYKKLACKRLEYGIYMISSEDREKDFGQLLGEEIINKVASMSIALETKVEGGHVVVDYGMWFFGGVTEFSSVCQKNVFLSPKSMTVKTSSGDGEKVRTVAFKDGMMEYERDGKQIEQEYPYDSVNIINLLRVIPQMPRKKGVRYEFDNMFNMGGGKEEKPPEGKRFAIVYSGKEDVEIGGNKVKCRRYDLVDVEKPISFYVDSKGFVQCVKAEQMVMKLLTKDEVVKLEEKRNERAKAAIENRAKMLEDIHGVISVGDNDDINRLLDNDPSLVNKKNDKGQTPLHIAVRLKKVDAVKLLIERGGDIAAVNDNAENCLFITRDVDTARYLLEQSAELLQGRNEWGHTPLHQAISRSREDMIKLLIEKGADVNAPNKRGEGPLWSWYGNKLSICETLLAGGADINAKTKTGWTLLHKMAANGRPEAFKLLVSKGADVEAVTNDELTVLHRAIDGQTAELILEKAPHLINQKDDQGRTPLYEVARLSKSDEAVEVLLSKGADINAVNKYTDTVLHVAAEDGQLEVVKCLLANGANISVVNKHGATVAHRAKKPEIMKYLLSLKPELANTRDKSGRTPLLTIAAMRSVESAKVLLTKGADIKAVNNKGRSALHYAAGYSAAAMCEFFIGKGLDVNMIAEEGKTPLHLAAGSWNTDAAKVLIDNGAKVNAKDMYGRTPLHQSIHENKVKNAEFLIANGADLNIKDTGGRTPLGVAVEFKRNDIVELLKKHGAN